MLAAAAIHCANAPPTKEQHSASAAPTLARSRRAKNRGYAKAHPHHSLPGSPKPPASVSWSNQPP